ncbi:MAG: iron-containing alcohol dehydrogenase [Clostridia bacterium]|nr:iron-containing alcohol dehydrogenase [Clostridia bacterium]
MSFNFYMPTAILSGEDIVRGNAGKFALGKKAIIVCGRNSAKACGALDDVAAVLEGQGIGYTVFNKIMENPLVSVCYEGGQLAIREGCDFVIGIGGGSPLDAAKAVAAYAANPGIQPMDIYGSDLKESLSILAIPTTAGTGSEVNPYSVMTLDGKNVKKTFKSPASYPKYAFLDPKYTVSLNRNYTVSTALDAFCHCAESYLSPKSTEVSRAFAVMGAQKLYKSLETLENIADDDNAKEAMRPLRYELLTGACAGGVAINATGTGFNHPLGYNLTLYYGIPHGRACGVFMQEYFAYNSRTDEGKSLIDAFCSALGRSAETVAAKIVEWSNVTTKLTDAEIALYIENVKGAGNYANSPYVINVDEMRTIYTKLFK